MSTSGIYALSGNGDPAQFLGDHGYLGLSIDLDRRHDEHFRSLKNGKHHNPYLQNYYNKYGSADYIIWFIVEECPQEILDTREIELIESHNTYENPKGFNLTPGGERGVSLAAAKPFFFEHIHDKTHFIGTNLAQFCRDNPEYDYDSMSRLRRGEISVYKDMIAIDHIDLFNENQQAAQVDAVQPATAVELETDDSKQSKPESEGRSL